MLKSMTGFGRAEQTVGDKTYLVELKALNGKQLELQLKLPPLLKPFEFDIRNTIQEHLIRGSVDCYITIKQNGTAKPVVINTELIKSYYKQLQVLAEELEIDTNAVLSSLLRLPEVVNPSNEMISPEDFKAFNKVLTSALVELNKYRIDEGNSLEKDLISRVSKIREQEEAILIFEPNRKPE